MNNNTKKYYNSKQGRLPLFISDRLDICDSVLAFDKIMEEIGREKYLKPEPLHKMGRPGYNRVNMLKTILFGFMDTGYASLRELEDRCRVNLRYMYLMDQETPSYRAFSYFINEEIKESAQDIFKAVISYIQAAEGTDLQHLYIDGSKFEANANKYTWVWKKATEKSRYRLFDKITTLLTEMNETLAYTGLKIETNTEYTPDSLEAILSRYDFVCHIDENTFIYGRGHRKSREQRYYERLKEYIEKLSEYVEKIQICGPERNSYAKTDHDATFMRMKKDYMGNDQLLPAYNIQIGVADEYIAVADAGYGSFNNYLFCQEHGMEKFMKFPMYKKETTDEKYHDDPFRAVNFETDSEGDLICPNGRKFHFAYRKAVKGNQYGRQEEYYTCEDCSGCPYAERCKKTEKNRTVRINAELSSMHQEVLENLQSIHGALLRMNRSIQAEGTFGIIKYDRWYKRIVRRGQESVRLELFLVSIGHNLYKFHNKQKRQREVA